MDSPPRFSVVPSASLARLKGPASLPSSTAPRTSALALALSTMVVTAGSAGKFAANGVVCALRYLMSDVTAVIAPVVSSTVNWSWFSAMPY